RWSIWRVHQNGGVSGRTCFPGLAVAGQWDQRTRPGLSNSFNPLNHYGVPTMRLTTRKVSNVASNALNNWFKRKLKTNQRWCSRLFATRGETLCRYRGFGRFRLRGFDIVKSRLGFS